MSATYPASEKIQKCLSSLSYDPVLDSDSAVKVKIIKNLFKRTKQLNNAICFIRAGLHLITMELSTRLLTESI